MFQGRKVFQLFLLSFFLTNTFAKADNETGFIVKFKKLETLSELRNRKTISATTKNTFNVEDLGGGWAKINGTYAPTWIQKSQRQIEYTQKDFKLGLIEDYKTNDPYTLELYNSWLKNNPERAKNIKDNPPIPTRSNSIISNIWSDPLSLKQWGMLDIGLTQITDIIKNHPPIIVAIIDTGVDYTHPDLVDNIWRNPGEIGVDENGHDKSTNGIDDDKNGFVDDVVGYDFAENDSFPYDKATSNWILPLLGGNPGHGTHCAGSIAAKGGNGIGISGIAPNAQIMVLRFLGNKGQGSTSDAIRAIRYAVDNGAKILNNSWGSTEKNENEGAENKALQEAIQYAESKGVLFVVAAGNGVGGQGINIEDNRYAVYPASYAFSNIMTVAAVDRSNQLGRFSNYGPKKVHLGAPGVGIFSTTVGGSYSASVIPFLAGWDGTSMAAPHVTGAAALYWSLHNDKTYLEVKEDILKSTVIIPALEGKTVSGGKLNLINLVK